ncbi:MAG: protein kinase [Verrucomicrobia bacterium]|nr:protein kinase [Verrucomicrobiota bacterium]
MTESNNEPDRPERELFLDAIEISDLGEREQFLAEACARDSDLRASVDALLENHKDDDFMQTVCTPIDSSGFQQAALNSQDVIGEKIGDRLGVYRLIQKIGEGGSGMVYLAEQEEPVRRRVAVKILKPGLETGAVIARFRSESQALALMDHPNIARVLDAGSTQSGRPFFVMDLVRGTRITEYCDQNQLSTGERLSLFVQVCQAVQHAHQKGIIHRDIKPSNVLVSLHDAKPVPKVIDFGIAKATERKLTERTALTEFHSFMGTPAYVSPEQAEMSGQDIDTRADIYSLGVLLYELLTGKTPFDPSELTASCLDDMRRTIRESEPMRPSTKIRTMLDAERTTTANRQRSDPLKLSSLLQGDLDWIILKSLEKDRTRRYDTANALAMDVGRFLENLPVLARPPSSVYRVRKFIRRNKLFSTAVSAFAGALAIGFGFTTWQWIEKSEAYRQIAISEQVEIGLREQAAAAKQVAETQALVNRRRAYASDMNLAQQALSVNNLGRARELLECYIPKEDVSDQSTLELDLRGWEWRYLWERCESDALYVLCQAADGVTSMSMSSDGDCVAIGEEWKDEISLWDLRSRERIGRFRRAQFSAPFLFSPTAPLLAFSTRDSLGSTVESQSGTVVRLWDKETRQVVGNLPIRGDCAAMAFSEDGARLITVTDSLRLSLWDLKKATELENRKLRGSAIPTGRFGFGPTTISADLRFLAYANGEGRVRVLDLTTGEAIWESKVAEERITELALSPDGSVLASSGGFVESTVRLWHVNSGLELARLEGHRTYIQSLVYWPDGKTLASASGDQTIRLWDVGKLNEIAETVTTFASQGRPWRPLTVSQSVSTFKGHKDEVWSLALSRDSGTLMSGGKDGVVSVWDTAGRSSEDGPIILPVAVVAWSFAPDSKSVVTLDKQGQLTRWHGERFQEYDSILNFDNNVKTVRFSNDGELVAANLSNEMIEVWSLNERTLIRRIGSVEDPEIPIRFIGASDHLVSLRVGSGEFRKWDIEAGTVLESWTVQAPQSAGSVMFSPSGTWSLQIYGEHAGTLRNSATGEQTKLDLNLRQVGRGAFSPDDRFIALVSALGVGHVWETGSAKRVAIIRGFLQGQHSAAFSPNSERLAIASNAREAVKLWDTVGYRELLTLEGRGSLFMSAAFSPDGNTLASCNWNGLLHIWQVPALDEISRH